ncbi:MULTISPECIES: restriction endonuclease subunit S [Pseudomonas]|uniref:restriction endonuclease subunit S n=1 Tax=Pseudomonadaceae TaxID=135621 RepID=UPI000489EA89|nr:MULTISPECIES: restriction endonuclease subunit S [Pseudomonas]
MGEVAQARPRAFSVSFSGLQTWSVAAQFAVNWSWPDEVIKPLVSILRRRNEAALETLTLESMVTLLTIRFDGSIEPREPVRIKDVKGRLFRVYTGDVVFSKIDVRNGAIGLAPNGIDCMCVTSEFPVYSVDFQRTDSEYVKLLFRTEAFKKLLNSMISGASGRKRIQPTQLEGVKVPIPALPIQQKIVAHWEAAKLERAAADTALSDLVLELHSWLVKQTKDFGQVTRSKVFLANYENTQQWDVKAGRAAAFITANPNFIRLGDYTEECAETVRPWDEPEKEWPIYGVNNKEGVFLSSMQVGKDFNAPYKKIEKDWFFHNPTRANVGSLGIVPEVPVDAITSPEYQVWRLKGGFLPAFMALMLRTNYFLALVAFNRVGGVKQRMYYANLAEIRLPEIPTEVQKSFADRRQQILANISAANEKLAQRKKDIEKMILGTRPVEVY